MRLSCFQIVFVLLVSFCSCIYAYTYPAECPKITPMLVDMEKLSGTWYEFTQSVGSGYSCIVFYQTYAVVEDEKYPLSLIHSQMRWDNGSVIDDREYSRLPPTLEGTYHDTAPDGRHMFTFYILDTDYTSYHVGFYCIFQDGALYQDVYIASRSKPFKEGTYEKAIEAIRRNGISLEIQSTPEGCEGLSLPESAPK